MQCVSNFTDLDFNIVNHALWLVVIVCCVADTHLTVVNTGIATYGGFSFGVIDVHAVGGLLYIISVFEVFAGFWAHDVMRVTMTTTALRFEYRHDFATHAHSNRGGFFNQWFDFIYYRLKCFGYVWHDVFCHLVKPHQQWIIARHFDIALLNAWHKCRCVGFSQKLDTCHGIFERDG